MADLGIHKTDLLYFLTGKRITETYAVMTTADKVFPDGRRIEVDDNAMAIYTNEDGVIGTMHAGWTNYGQEINSTRLYCKNGVIRCYDDPDYSLIIEKKNGEVIKMNPGSMPSNEEQISGIRVSSGIIDAFIDSILTGVQPGASGQSAMHAMDVIFANIESSLTRRPQKVELR